MDVNVFSNGQFSVGHGELFSHLLRDAVHPGEGDLGVELPGVLGCSVFMFT